MLFSRIFTNAKTALVIVPEDPTHRTMVMSTLTMLQNKFHGPQLTIVIHDAFRDFSTTFVSSSIVRIKRAHLNFFFLPKKNEIQQLLEQKFDVIVDLNLTHVPVAAYLCTHIQAPLKVGFAKEYADTFYNFQFNASPNRNIKSRYEQMFRALSMF